MKVRILANNKKEWALSLTRSISKLLALHGFVISDRDEDVTFCIGGDGTIFHFFHTNAIRGAILGVGSKTSTVCQLKHETLGIAWLLRILKNNKTENRLSLIAESKKKRYRSINDVVLHTHNYRVITISLHINKKTYKFEGDGLIISTPTGSTAYAYSAGGAMLSHRERKIEVVPICPYRRAFIPLVVDEKAKITISADRSADFIIDGIYIGRLEPGEKIAVKKGKDVEFLKIK